jgi:hypothetical protein
MVSIGIPLGFKSACPPTRRRRPEPNGQEWSRIGSTLRR